MAKKSKFQGKWLITEMDAWDDDDIHAEEPAFIEFKKDGSGTFKFGYVNGIMDCRSSLRGEQEAMEFSWEGNDESDEAFGRGWVVMDEKGKISGNIYFHMGEESGFVAEKK